MTASIRSFSENRQLLRGGSGGGATTLNQAVGTPQGISQGLQQGTVARGPSLQSLQDHRRNLITDFNQQLGPDLSLSEFDRTDIRGVVRRAGQGDTSGVDRIREILSREYTGPAGLSDQAQDLVRQAEDQRGVFDLLSQGRGVETHLRSLSPGLSAGEARFERRENIGSDFFRSARDQSQGFGALAETLRTDISDASRRASDQQGNALEARSDARSLLASLSDRIAGVVDERVDARTGERDRLAGVFSDLLRDPLDEGSLGRAGLSGVREALQGDEQFQSRVAAEGQLGALAEFSDLERFEALDAITGRGTPIRAIRDPLTGNAFRVDKLEEGLFRNPQNRGLETPDDEFLRALPRLLERESIQSQFGRLGELAPFATSQALPELGSLFSFDPGGTFNRLNTATQVEDRQADFIASLLGTDSVIGELSDPAPNPTITADVPSFLSRNSEAMARAEAEAQGLGAQYQSEVDRVRRRYLDSKDGFLGDILNIASFVPIPGIFAPAQLARNLI